MHTRSRPAELRTQPVPGQNSQMQVVWDSNLPLSHVHPPTRTFRLVRHSTPVCPSSSYNRANPSAHHLLATATSPSSSPAPHHSNHSPTPLHRPRPPQNRSLPPQTGSPPPQHRPQPPQYGNPFLPSMPTTTSVNRALLYLVSYSNIRYSMMSSGRFIYDLRSTILQSQPENPHYGPLTATHRLPCKKHSFSYSG